MIATIAATLLFLFWLYFFVSCYFGLRQVPILRDVDPLSAPDAPRLTVLVPARNEEAAIAQCLESLATQTYPNLEVIFINDRSTDRTADLAAEVARKYPGKIETITVTECPPGWLGKCNALRLGAERATGEFILFTDGDIIYEPTSLARAMRLVVDTRCDHMVVTPELITSSFLERVLVMTFAQNFVTFYPPWRAMNPRSRVFIGLGAFNLSRKSHYEKTGGHEPLRLQVLDDIALGKQMKTSGGRIAVALGEGMVSVRWQDSFFGTIRGLEKNAFAAMGYNVPRTIAGIVLLVTGYLWPWVGMFWGPTEARILCAATALILQPTMGFAANRIAGVTPLIGYTAPLGAMFMAFTLARSMGVTLAQGGVRWRDTFYPLSELRQFRL